jgi:hypothetical protein
VSKLSDQVVEASEFGHCVTRMGVCHCHEHINEAARLIGAQLREILFSAADGNAGPRLVAYIKQLEESR